MISLQGVSKTYPGGHTALKNIDLTVPAGETMALLGPSGCGKTTTLKLINRLLDTTLGTVSIDGKDVQSGDPVELRRGIGYVVQEAGLFPHMTALENVCVVPSLLGWAADRQTERARELFQIVGLEFDTHGPRVPAELSGGQRQRVGIARAIAADPPIILMDEPFGALDPITRKQIRAEFKELKNRLGKTVVLVTHDVEEAFDIADHLAIFSVGELVQHGTPDEIRENPASDFVREFLS